jgi:hypothetical protein
MNSIADDEGDDGHLSSSQNRVHADAEQMQKQNEQMLEAFGLKH